MKKYTVTTYTNTLKANRHDAPNQSETDEHDFATLEEAVACFEKIDCKYDWELEHRADWRRAEDKVMVAEIVGWNLDEDGFATGDGEETDYYKEYGRLDHEDDQD